MFPAVFRKITVRVNIGEGEHRKSETREGHTNFRKGNEIFSRAAALGANSIISFKMSIMWVVWFQDS